MIIRKPFAFIVHRFKTLHLIVLIPCLYIAYMMWNLMNFFNDFVGRGYVTTIEGVLAKYYSFLMLIAPIIVIIFALLVRALFNKKNKNSTPYSIIVLHYIAFIIYVVLLPSLLMQAQNAELASSTSLIVRGVTSIFFYTNIICILLQLLLTFGFDFMSGEFLDIKEEINLDEEDNEEVEINVNKEDYKFKRWINRYIREIKYYIIENKNIFKVLGIIAGAILLIFFVGFLISLNRIVRVDQKFNYSSFSFKFNNSYLTTLDYGGNNILDGKVYLATKVTISNLSNGLESINTDDFCLDINDNCIYPTLDRSGKFLDLAKPYYGEKIGPNQTYEYVLVYELDSNLTNAKYKIKILDKLTHKKDDVIPTYKVITLTPTYTTSVSRVGTYYIDDEVKFDKTSLLNTTLKIKSYELMNTYRYTYDFCYNEKCMESQNAVAASSGKTLIVLDADFNMDENASYTKFKLGTNDFFEDFGNIEYTVNGNTYITKVYNKTPKEANKIVLEVNSSIKDAQDMNLLITIRDKCYTIKLKEEKKE